MDISGAVSGTHPKGLIRDKREVRERRLFFSPFARYARIPEELSVREDGFQFDRDVCRRILRIPAREADVKTVKGNRSFLILSKREPGSKGGARSPFHRPTHPNLSSWLPAKTYITGRPVFVPAWLISFSPLESLYTQSGVFSSPRWRLSLFRTTSCMKRPFEFTRESRIFPSWGQRRNPRGLFLQPQTKIGRLQKRRRDWQGKLGFFCGNDTLFLAVFGGAWKGQANGTRRALSLPCYYLSGLRSTMPMTKIFFPGLMPPLMCPQNGTIWGREQPKIKHHRDSKANIPKQVPSSRGGQRGEKEGEPKFLYQPWEEHFRLHRRAQGVV